MYFGIIGCKSESASLPTRCQKFILTWWSQEEVYIIRPPNLSIAKRKINIARNNCQGSFKRSIRTLTKIWSAQGWANHTIFVKHKGGTTTALIVYGDDIVFSNDATEFSLWKKTPRKRVWDWRLGSLKDHFWALRLLNLTKIFLIVKRKYVLDLLKEIRTLGFKWKYSPLEVNYQFIDKVGQNSFHKCKGYLKTCLQKDFCISNMVTWKLRVL